MKCNLCGKADYKVRYLIKTDNNHFKASNKESIGWKEIRIVECRNCGLVFTFPRPHLGEIVEKVYTEEYHERHKANVEVYERRLNQIRRYYQSGSLLDVGCGYGYFLKCAARYFDTMGLEVSPGAANFVVEEQKIPVITGDFLKVDIRRQFDVVTLWDVIEHLYDPFAALLKVNKILRKHGLIALRTENISSVNARFAGSKWEQLNYEDHMYFFSKATIKKMLNKTGFGVLLADTERNSFPDFVSWARRVPRSVAKAALARFNEFAKSDRIADILKTKPTPIIPTFADLIVVIAKKECDE